MSDISSKATGFDRAVDGLTTLAERIQNPGEKLMRRLGDVVVEDIEERFMTAGEGSWAPLSPETVRRKGSAFILIDSGAMFASLALELRGENAVRVSVPYGGANHDPQVPGYHQRGTARMPQRKIIANTPALRRALYDAAAIWLRDMVAACFVKA